MQEGREGCMLLQLTEIVTRFRSKVPPEYRRGGEGCMNKILIKRST
jgi:hypothetical protein